MTQEKQENKSFLDLIGKYLVINGQEPGFKIKKIEQAPFEAYTSIIFCEHNLILYMTDACIEMIREENVVVTEGNNYSIREEPKDIKNLFTNTGTEATDIDLWKERWWDVFFEFVKMGAYSEYSINATSNIIKDAMKEMNNFFKDK